ncbi:MAG: ureidoglycolate lyase [Spirochaetota bacterium]
MRVVQAKKLSVEGFKPYGWALLRPDKPADIESASLRYWHDMVDLSNLGRLGTMGFMQMKRIPISCVTLQALPNSIEMYLSLDGKPSLFFVAPGDRSGKAPDEARIEAFILEGGGSVIVEKGIWHVAPFPLSETSDFALGLHNTVILRKGDGFIVNEKEISYVTLSEPVTIAL